MPAKRKSVPAPAAAVEGLFHRVVAILDTRQTASGELGSSQDLSRRLTAEFGRGFDPSNLRYMRLLFQRFSNRDAVRRRLPSPDIRDALRRESSGAANRNAVRSQSSNVIKRDAPGLELRPPDAARTYLKRVDAPAGVKPALRCWMELNE